MYEVLRKLALLWISCFGSSRQKTFIAQRKKQDFTELTPKIQYWIHASSIGEVNLLDSFMKDCLEKLEGDFLLSVFTDTGWETAKKKYEKEARVHVCYFPFDEKKQLQEMTKRMNIQTVFIVETELWPNFIEILSAKTRVVVINGRISERSFRRYQKIRFLLEPVLKKISHFYLQTEEDKNRFVHLGADEKKCMVVGNLKFDIQVPMYSEEEKENFKKDFGLLGKKIWVAGSTRSGEYDILLEAFQKLSSDYVLVLVPRHLERIPEIQTILEKKRLSYQCYQEMLQSSTRKEARVLLVDAMAVLRKFYAVADTTFVGGTLVNIGGHSLLEPLCYSKTPMFGKYTQNVKEIAGELLKRNLGYQIESAEEILLAIDRIEKQTTEVTEEIKNFLQANRQVGRRILESEDK